MKTMDIGSQIAPRLAAVSDIRLDRRRLFRQAGMFGLGAAVAGLALKGTPAKAQANTYQSTDTVAEMFTAFLIAEDLATTFYYNGLIGGVIQDPKLAGPGGSATHITGKGQGNNVQYLQAALVQEKDHANYFRTLLTGTPHGASADPYQNFYFPAGTFDTLTPFLGILNALENAFIGAYLTLIQELAYKASAAQTGILTGADTKYSVKEYTSFAAVAASILGVESEHRVLGRDIGGEMPANNLIYEQTDTLTSIYNGPHSAVVALTPFLTPSTGPGYSLATALANLQAVVLSINTNGSAPNL
jgi:hypothetical protein